MKIKAKLALTALLIYCTSINLCFGFDFLSNIAVKTSASSDNAITSASSDNAITSASSDNAITSASSDNAIIWKSKNRSKEQLNKSIEQLYLTLFNYGVLPTKTIIFDNTKYSSISELLVKNGIKYGVWSDTIDNIICDLNYGFCDRPRTLIEDFDLQSNNQYIGGREITSSKETNWYYLGRLDDAPIRVPDVSFEKTTDYKRFLYSEGNNDLWSLVESNASACDFSSANTELSCLQLVISLNVNKWFKNAFQELENSTEAEDTNSIAQLEAFLNDLRTVNESTSPQYLKQAVNQTNAIFKKYGYDSSSSSYSALLPIEKLVYVFTPDEKQYLKIKNSDEVYRTNAQKNQEMLIKNSDAVDLGSEFYKVEKLRIKKDQASTNSPIIEGPIDFHQKKIFKSINFEEPVIKNANGLDVFLGLVDSGFQPEFCEFTKQSCDGQWSTSIRLPSSQHGNAVAAIATAHMDNDGIDGIMPGLHVRELSFDIIESDSGFLLAEKIRELKTLNDGINYQFSTPVWNLSFHLDSNNQGSLLWQLMRDFDVNEFNDIFVAAAGNIKKEKMDAILKERKTDPEVCNFYPVCLSNKRHPNLIRVAAFEVSSDGKKTIWEGGVDNHGVKYVSFYHPSKIDIAASAEAVVPVVKDGTHHFTIDEGTSFATAQVSGVVASLMAPRNNNMNPVKVRLRIITCGEQTLSNHKKIRGGFLDVECSLDFTNDRIKLKGSDTVKSGTIRRLFGGDKELDSFALDDKRVLLFKTEGASRLYHFTRLEDEDNSTLFLYRDENSVTGGDPLDLRKKRIKHWHSTSVFEFVSSSGKVECIPVSQVKDVVFSLKGYEHTDEVRSELEDYDDDPNNIKCSKA